MVKGSHFAASLALFATLTGTEAGGPCNHAADCSSQGGCCCQVNTQKTCMTTDDCHLFGFSCVGMSPQSPSPEPLKEIVTEVVESLVEGRALGHCDRTSECPFSVRCCCPIKQRQYCVTKGDCQLFSSTCRPDLQQTAGQVQNAVGTPAGELAPVANSAGGFQIVVNGQSKACEFESQSNSYGAATLTRTDPSLWVEDGGNWDLKYLRQDASHALGGRCATDVMSEISGEGVFTAEIYVHSNVADGTGVFTIAALPSPFDVHDELDLFVVNVEHNTIKSGKPLAAKSYTMSDYLQKWIEVKITKHGDSCSSSISAMATGEMLQASSGLSCSLAAASRIVINARARDGTDSGDSFVSVRSVSWRSGGADEPSEVVV